MPPRNSMLRIRDILNETNKIISYTDGLTEESLSQDNLTLDAVLRNLTVIGEAARHIPDDVAEKHPEIPWAEMRDMRNIVVHEYFGVDLSILWKTVQEDIPKLAEQLESLLAD